MWKVECTKKFLKELASLPKEIQLNSVGWVDKTQHFTF